MNRQHLMTAALVLAVVAIVGNVGAIRRIILPDAPRF